MWRSHTRCTLLPFHPAATGGSQLPLRHHSGNQVKKREKERRILASQRQMDRGFCCCWFLFSYSFIYIFVFVLSSHCWWLSHLPDRMGRFCCFSHTRKKRPAITLFGVQLIELDDKFSKASSAKKKKIGRELLLLLIFFFFKVKRADEPSSAT